MNILVNISLTSSSLHFNGQTRAQISSLHHKNYLQVMAKLNRAFIQLKIKWVHCIRFAFIRSLFAIVWNHILSCSSCNHGKYHRLTEILSSPSIMVVEDNNTIAREIAEIFDDFAFDTELVSLKISLLGDCHTGKTSFMIKYAGGQKGMQMNGLNIMDKVLVAKGVRIAFRIWDVGGDDQFGHHVPLACKDAVAILIMFDLTNRHTLNNAFGWFQYARKWNKTASPILIGTKFDNFVQLPLEVQWMIVTQARACAKAMKATLFFSSSTHNINVHKIFKFIAAKYFNLPWTVERNLTIGEPIIDF